MAAAVLAEDVTQIHVDLSGVTFTDSTGIGALVVGKRRASECGKQFDVVAAHDSVRMLMDVIGVWGYLSDEPD